MHTELFVRRMVKMLYLLKRVRIGLNDLETLHWTATKTFLFRFRQTSNIYLFHFQYTKFIHKEQSICFLWKLAKKLQYIKPNR